MTFYKVAVSRIVLEAAMEIACWHTDDGDECGELARALVKRLRLLGIDDQQPHAFSLKRLAEDIGVVEP